MESTTTQYEDDTFAGLEEMRTDAFDAFSRRDERTEKIPLADSLDGFDLSMDDELGCRLA